MLHSLPVPALTGAPTVICIVLPRLALYVLILFSCPHADLVVSSDKVSGECGNSHREVPLGHMVLTWCPISECSVHSTTDNNMCHYTTGDVQV